MHRCEFCESKDTAYFDIVLDGTELTIVANGEIWIPTVSGKRVFVASRLIYHYINEHQYLPPQQFLDALTTFELDSGRDADLAYVAIVSNYRPADFILAASYIKLLGDKVDNLLHWKHKDFWKQPQAQKTLAKINEYIDQFS